MKRRQQDLVTKFLQLRLHLRALLDQWEGLHSLNGMKRREYNHELHKRRLIPPFWKMAEKWRSQMEKWIAPLHLWHREGLKTYNICPIQTKCTFIPPALLLPRTACQKSSPLHFLHALGFISLLLVIGTPKSEVALIIIGAIEWKDQWAQQNL